MSQCGPLTWRNPARKPVGGTGQVSPKVSGTKNGGTVPYKAILGVRFPLHMPYIQLI